MQIYFAWEPRQRGGSVGESLQCGGSVLRFAKAWQLWVSQMELGGRRAWEEESPSHLGCTCWRMRNVWRLPYFSEIWGQEQVWWRGVRTPPTNSAWCSTDNKNQSYKKICLPKSQFPCVCLWVWALSLFLSLSLYLSLSLSLPLSLSLLFSLSLSMSVFDSLSLCLCPSPSPPSPLSLCELLLGTLEGECFWLLP